jgi:3-hydroxyisobutyrate dehydrogenase-like beta-hydroxyacid dehydrogenase
MLSGMKLPAMAAGDFEPHFTLSNMEKDSRYVRELAAEVGLQTPAIDAVSARMAELCATGLADLDFSALAKAYL